MVASDRAQLFAGQGIVEAEIKAAALAWVPEPMRFAASEADGADGKSDTTVTDDGSPPWSDDATASNGEIAVAIADEEDVAIAAEPEPAAPELEPAEPIEVTFVADDPKLAKVVFAFGDAEDVTGENGSPGDSEATGVALERAA